MNIYMSLWRQLQKKKSGFIILIASVLFASGVMAEQTGSELSLAEAEAIALKADPMLNLIDANAQALDEAAIADGQLPDPKMSFSLFNFPTDTFSRTQEPITQLRFGLQQAIPRGDTLELKSKRTSIKAGLMRAKNADEELKLRSNVRKFWFETWYWVQAERTLNKDMSLFRQLVDITESQYAAGKQNQQDVIRAELEYGLLEDRLTHIKQQQEAARAELSQWLGTESLRTLPDELPALPALPSIAEIQASLTRHPALRVFSSKIDMNRKSVAIAREAYKPAWTLGLNYGIRDGDNPDGSKRADFLAASIGLDLPLFTDKRQDRRLASAQKLASAAQLELDDKYAAMKSMLERDHVTWTRLAQRLKRYEQSLINQAVENSEASLLAYQNDTTDFATLMRAKITELNTNLKALRIHTDYAKAHARLLYLAGEQK